MANTLQKLLMQEEPIPVQCKKRLGVISWRELYRAPKCYMSQKSLKFLKTRPDMKLIDIAFATAQMPALKQKFLRRWYQIPDVCYA